MLLFDRTRKIAFNRNFALSICAGLLLALLTCFSFSENEIGIGIGFAFFTAVLLAAPIICLPWCYIFDPEGVSLKYIFFSQERYLWKNIHSIYVADAISDGGRSSLFIHDFKIEGNIEGKQRRYMNARICKTWRTKRLITQYWDGTIEGYWHDEVQAVKKWWHKRTGKKLEQPRRYMTNEVVLMERQARTAVRKCLEPFIMQIKQYDLQVRTQYLYITEDYGEHHSRPQAPHTYTVINSICHPGETDEDRMIIIYTDMIRVRIGKNAYRGIANQQAEDELKYSFADIVTHIQQQGFEGYLNDLLTSQ